jgi:protein YIPF1/2
VLFSVVFYSYGPFWTCTTLIFVAASIATFVTYLSHKWHKKEWNYDINLVTWSAGLFYGYVTFVPLLLYVILKYFSAPAGLVQLWCLYGYSLFIFIPASVRNLPKTVSTLFDISIGAAVMAYGQSV